MVFNVGDEVVSMMQIFPFITKGKTYIVKSEEDFRNYWSTTKLPPNYICIKGDTGGFYGFDINIFVAKICPIDFFAITKEVCGG